MIVGAAWKRKDKNGNDYLSVSLDLGMLGKRSVVIYPIKPEEKKSDKSPDYRVTMFTPEEKQAKSDSHQTNQINNSPFNDDQIPF